MNRQAVLSPIPRYLIIGTSLILLATVLFHLLSRVDHQWTLLWDYRTLFYKGWIATLILSLCSFVLSSLIGITCAVAKISKRKWAHFPATFFIETIRNTPFLVQILIFFYIIAHNIGLQNRFLVGVIALSMFSGAYLAEIFRAGIESIATSQIESARALGLTKKQIYRLVIFPQAFRRVLPPLAGQFASLIKDSSLLSIIGINELTYNAGQINSATYSTFESFIPLAIGYFLLTFPISCLSSRLEKRFSYET